jgi:enoyl-CoA hydratase/carnithine racemase
MDRRLLPFEEYAKSFSHIEMQRQDGILQLTQHSDGGTLQWGGEPQTQLSKAFRFVGADPDNHVIIFTGAGECWNGPEANTETEIQYRRSVDHWDTALWNGRQLAMALLDIEAPVIAAINGPVHRHAELPLLSDIVLASEDVTFDDKGHFPVNLVAGDGVFAVTSLLMGHNRARYFHMMGETLNTAAAKNMGLISEILPREAVLARAWEIARMLIRKPPLALRYQRLVFIHPLKQRLLEVLGYSLALEGLAASSGGMPESGGGRSSNVY